ncbi:MAG TPA: hypothetical protein VK897_27635 [Anaerolineales bacterium]|nr:hypothetical protein [Anaerolineales bacterium]
MKTILKPTLLKIALTLVLLVLSSYLWRMYVTSTISDTFPWGFPLQFYLAWGPCPPGEVCSENNVLFLILDLMFWYMVSGFFVSKLGRAHLERKTRE